MRTESPTERSTFTTLFVPYLAAVLWLAHPPGIASAATTDDLSELSLEQLMDIEVTSVSKRAQKISEAPAAVTVVTAEDIRRSGATTIPEALRMVPGLHVAHIDNNRMAITARGFNGVYANKLLVLIDGRSVYTPLFAGVYWDVKDVVIEDIERIEVVRGPGGTLWGANAVNGVINIITKKSKDTGGAMLSGGGGSLEDGIASFRYGYSVSDDIHTRVYGKYLHTDTLDPRSPAPGTPVNDARRIGSTGFRVDWDATQDNAFTLQGDYYNGEADYYGTGVFATAAPETQDVWGVNLLARWQSAFAENSDFSAQLYYDRNERDSPILDQALNTFDVELQYGFAGLPRQVLTVGANYRLNWDDIGESSNAIAFSPSSSTDHLISGFIQDEITVLPDLLKLIVGSKFEYNQFTEFEFQPNLRLLATPHPRHTVWGAVSRAVRTPARGDSDIDIDISIPGFPPFIPPVSYRFFGDRGLDAEDLLAVELGYRAQPLDRVSVDIAVYFNDYNDLIVYDTPPSDPTVCLPTGTTACIWQKKRNKLDGIGWGVEASATWAVFDFWKLMGSYTYMDQDLEPDIGSTATDSDEDTTPLHQFGIRSQLDLPWNLEADAALYYVGKLKNLGVDSYPRVDVRLGWEPMEDVELSILGRNLQERRHLEYTSATYSINSAVPRSVFAKLVLRY